MEITEILQNINSSNFREVQDYLNENEQRFRNEETKRINAACREHIKTYNIKVGDWFNYTYTQTNGYNGTDKITYMYELQVVKINRTCLKAKGFQISPHAREVSYPIDVPILKVIP